MTIPTRQITLLSAVLVALAVPVTAHAAKVYRCGPDGRIYSQTPCKDGYEINVADKRSTEQRKAAEDSVKREEKMVEKMTQERTANEAAAAKQGAATIVNPAAAKPATPGAAASAAAAKQAGAKKDMGAAKDTGTKKGVGAKGEKKP